MILTVPCCQHEFYSKISNPDMAAVTRHGILRERLAAISPTQSGAAAGVSGLLHRDYGIHSDRNTPKNLLIKGVRRGDRPLEPPPPLRSTAG